MENFDRKYGKNIKKESMKIFIENKGMQLVIRQKNILFGVRWTCRSQ